MENKIKCNHGHNDIYNRIGKKTNVCFLLSFTDFSHLMRMFILGMLCELIFNENLYLEF